LAHGAAAGDLAVRPLAPFFVFEQGKHRAALVLVGAAEAVGGVGANGEEDGVAAGALADVGQDGPVAVLAPGVETVEAIPQPVVAAIVDELDGRELGAGLHVAVIVVDHGLVDAGAGLGAAVEADVDGGDALGLGADGGGHGVLLWRGVEPVGHDVG
ncbi:hypothetical protein RZS08_25200, partial [Arthrospira platensis SPKY1]|nr:hypothetical protein [Arthrospira platensis SPKY1]